MIKADTHLHTCYSHARNTPFEMYAAALAAGLDLIGFSEHSPRPDGFDYADEYRDKLVRHLSDYINRVTDLREQTGSCRVLLGMEIDWLSGEEAFTAKSCRQFDFNYLLGSVHFIDRWGFDNDSGSWQNASQEQCEKWYEQYFDSWQKMLASGLFNIASHPDLIKIFTPDQFHIWLAKPESRQLIRQCLQTLKNSGMAMEISSAGLRKPCGEIYPCAPIMAMAAELELPISFASDAHCAKDVAYAFPRLASYASAFGFRKQSVFDHGARTDIVF